MTMKDNKMIQKPVGLLPKDKIQALNALIKATQSLIEISDREAGLLAQNDMMALHIAQSEKAFLTARYEKLSTEFRGRLEEFRGADRTILDRLESLQTLLGKKTKANNQIVTGLCKTAREKTQSSLFTIQELAQDKPVRLNGETQQGVQG